MPEPVATVVVLNWNGGHLLPPCLAALARQEGVSFQTWVVDNASTDGSVELVEREFPDVRLLRNDRNLGFAGGNNAALREITTPFAVLLNNDARPEPDWLARLLEPFGAPGSERLGATTSKVLFEPRFLALDLVTDGFVPGGADPRELGVRFARLRIDGEDVTERVLWESLTWGPEGAGDGRFRWARPAGRLLVPLPPGPGPYQVEVRWAAERDKTATLSWPGGEARLAVAAELGDVAFTVPAGVDTTDVINNAGSIVLTSGYGADRGYQETDRGQYDEPAGVVAVCGCAVAFRTEAGRAAGWFDEDFFLYYEDTDLSWRLRALGWDLRYQPAAVVRHIHSATSVEWSPLFVFHTDRNRLLMLTKNAPLGLAVREVARYPLTTASMALRAARIAAAGRTRPPVRPTLMRLRVFASYLRLLPVMLARRAALARSAAVGRRALAEGLVVSR